MKQNRQQSQFLSDMHYNTEYGNRSSPKGFSKPDHAIYEQRYTAYRQQPAETIEVVRRTHCEHASKSNKKGNLIQSQHKPFKPETYRGKHPLFVQEPRGFFGNPIIPSLPTTNCISAAKSAEDLLEHIHHSSTAFTACSSNYEREMLARQFQNRLSRQKPGRKISQHRQQQVDYAYLTSELQKKNQLIESMKYDMIRMQSELNRCQEFMTATDEQNFKRRVTYTDKIQMMKQSANIPKSPSIRQEKQNPMVPQQTEKEGQDTESLRKTNQSLTKELNRMNKLVKRLREQMESQRKQLEVRSGEEHIKEVNVLKSREGMMKIEMEGQMKELRKQTSQVDELTREVTLLKKQREELEKTVRLREQSRQEDVEWKGKNAAMLERELIQLRQKNAWLMNFFQNNRSQGSNVNALRTELEQLRKASIEFKKVDQELQKAQDHSRTKQMQVNKLTSLSSQLEEALEESQQKLVRIAKEANAVKQEHNACKAEVMTYRNEVSIYKSEAANYRSELAAMKLSQTAQINSRAQQIELVMRSHEEKVRELQKGKERALVISAEENARLKKALEEEEGKSAGVSKKLAQYTRELTGLQKSLQESEEMRAKLEEEVRHWRGKHDDVFGSFRQLKSDHDQLQTRYTSLLEQTTVQPSETPQKSTIEVQSNRSIPDEFSRLSAESFLEPNFVQIDENALIYISEMLGVKPEKGILLKNIIHKLQEIKMSRPEESMLLDRAEQSSKALYMEVVQIFAVEMSLGMPEMHQSLLDEISRFKQTLQSALKQVKDMETEMQRTGQTQMKGLANQYRQFSQRVFVLEETIHYLNDALLRDTLRQYGK